MAEKKIATSIRLSSDSLERLDRLAGKWGVSKTDVIEQLLREADRGDMRLRVVK